MKSFQLRFIWVALLLPINCFILIDGYVSDATSFAQYTESTDSDLMETSANSLKQQNCGRIYTFPSGGIFHKALETLSGNEHCVWIVRVREARSYTVKIDSLGYPSEDRLLTITGFNHEVNNESVHYFPTSSGEVIQINNSTLLVITFKFQFSQASSNKHVSGFSLQYKSFETEGVIEGGKSNETRCGNVMLGDNGFIIYKPFETALEGERCAWTIAVHGAMGYKINLQHMGFQPNERLITVAGFRKSDSNVTYYVPTATGEVMVEDVNILVITFHSLQENTKGFALQYSTLYTGRSFPTNPRSRHVILGPETIYLKHPPGNYFGDYYQNNELSTFVFPPKNNIFTEAGEAKIVYKRNGDTGVEGSKHSCYDSLNFWIFNATTNHWDFTTRICGDSDTKLISGKDIILAVFDSDTSGAFLGFHMTYAN